MAKRKRTGSMPHKVLIPVLLLTTVLSGALLLNYRSVIGGGEYNALLSMDVIYNNIFVNNYEVAGLTKEQALEKLDRELQKGKFEKKVIYLQLPHGSSDDVITLTYKDMGMQYDFAPAVEEAYNYGREGLPAQRRALIEGLEDKGKFFTAQYSYDRDKIINLLKTHEDEINKRLSGKTMDIDRTADMIGSMLDIDSYDCYINIPTK